MVLYPDEGQMGITTCRGFSFAVTEYYTANTPSRFSAKQEIDMVKEGVKRKRGERHSDAIAEKFMPS